MCQEIHETWLKLLPVALLQIKTVPEEMLKLSHFEFTYSRPFLGSFQILRCPDPLIEQSIKYSIQLGRVTRHKQMC